MKLFCIQDILVFFRSGLLQPQVPAPYRKNDFTFALKTLISAVNIFIIGKLILTFYLKCPHWYLPCYSKVTQIYRAFRLKHRRLLSQDHETEIIKSEGVSLSYRYYT